MFGNQSKHARMAAESAALAQALEAIVDKDTASADAKSLAMAIVVTRQLQKAGVNDRLRRMMLMFKFIQDNSGSVDAN